MKKKTNIKIGILDGQTIQAMSIARQLKMSGYSVILFCETMFSYGYFTRYADRRVICPSTKNNPEIFHRFLTNYLSNYALDVLIPMNDDSAKYISLYKNDLIHLTRFVMPDYEIFMRGYDKNELMKLCKKENIPHPKTIDLSAISEIGNIIEINFPALIKPNETTGARGFALVNNLEEVRTKLPEIIKNYGRCHLQEYIPEGGKQFKVQILISNGELVNSTVIRKDRYYPVKGGSSCFCETITRNDLVELCLKVLKLIHWEGFADFDLIEDPENKECKIMEINPRIPACIKASLVSGVDFANLIVDASLNKEPSVQNYVPGKFLRYFGMDVLWLLSNKRKIDSFKIWRKGFFLKEHYFQDATWSDPLSFIFGTISSISKQLDPRFRAKKKEMN